MPAYREQIVTFLDIMGFRELVHSHDADAIAETLDAIKATAAISGDGEGERTSIISFSDSVIRARPCAKNTFIAFLHEVAELAAAQWALMESGILVRGGITIGDVLITTDRAFGPAFVRAYDLESKPQYAVSPRVIVDPDLVDQFRALASRRDYPGRRSLVADLRASLRRDNDGKWFVDYVANAHHRLGPTVHRAAMVRHRETIIEIANEFEPGTSVFAKYGWLIRYFNDAANRFHPGFNALTIRNTDVPDFESS